MFTHLVTSGCSFSDSRPTTITWPRHLAEILGVKLYNRAQASVGNDWVRRTAIYQTRQLLTQGVAADSILCMVMWTGWHRLSLWVNREQTPRFTELCLANQNPLTYWDSQPNQPWGHSSPERGWLVGSPSCTFGGTGIQRYKTMAMAQYWPDEALAIHTLEQWQALSTWCRSEGIALGNQLWQKDSLHAECAEWPVCQDLLAELRPQEWLGGVGQSEFTREQCLPFEADGLHPGTRANLEWTRQKILPWLQEHHGDRI